jgi:hypothetical protein
MALSSGLLEMIAEARLISGCFGGAEVDLRGGETRDGSEVVVGYRFALFASTDCLWLACAGTGAGEVFTWKASSANLSATL